MPKTAESSPIQQNEPGVEKPLACPTEARVDPRVKRTRKLIEDAYRTLIASRRYSEISVADITEVATINRATFYLHFEGKEHLAESLLQDDFRDAVIHRIHQQDHVSRESFVELATATIEFVDRAHGNCPKEIKEHEVFLSSAVIDLVQRVLHRWFELDRRAIRIFGDASPGAVASAFSWAVYGAAVDWRRQGRTAPAREVAEQLLNLLASTSSM